MPDEISDEQVIQMLAAAERLKPQIVRAFMISVLKSLPKSQLAAFVHQVRVLREESGIDAHGR